MLYLYKGIVVLIRTGVYSERDASFREKWEGESYY